MSASPTVTAAHFPSDYGQTEEHFENVQTWAEVEARIAAAKNYILSTIDDSGHPYQRPVDGVFVEGALCFGGSPQTRWVRNLTARPAVSVTLPDDDHAVIISGTAVLVEDPELDVSKALWPANRAKYPQYFTDASEDETPAFDPFWCLRPDRIYAWSLSEFPARATRFDF